MADRLPTQLLLSALLRRVNDAGGFAVVLARGDPQAGAVLLVARDRGANPRLLERGIGPDGRTAMIESALPEDLDAYLERRRRRDPDLWIAELNIANAERFAADALADG